MSQDTSKCTNVKHVLIRLTLGLNFEQINSIFKLKQTQFVQQKKKLQEIKL